MHHAHSHRQSLIFRPGADVLAASVTDYGLVLECPMPWLAGPESQVLARGTGLECPDSDGLLRDGETLAGVLIGNAGAALEDESLRLYRRLFALTRGLNRYRIWNFVPDINGVVAGVENYVAFNSGRHQAFTEQFGAIHRQELPAASAVGTKGGTLALAFAAGPDAVEHFENPLQTPAADYPRRYGRNAPLFARGSRVRAADGSTRWYLSGTASIRSSDTVGADFARQLDITLENIALILRSMDVPMVRQGDWKIFLRNRRDLVLCRQRLGEVYPAEADRMMFVETDICRHDLLLEIEGMFHHSPSPIPNQEPPPP